MVCQSCDHGQRYCVGQCRQIARKESLKRANKKYQNSLKGRLNNAERQRRFRHQKKLSEKIVTDQGSPSKHSRDLLFIKVCAPKSQSKMPNVGTKAVCHFCGLYGGLLFRTGFLKIRTFYPYRSKQNTSIGANKYGC